MAYHYLERLMMTLVTLLTLVVLAGGPEQPKHGEQNTELHCFEVVRPQIPIPYRVRKPSVGSDDLFLWREFSKACHFYNHEKKTLSVADMDQWHEAKGAIATVENERTAEPDVKITWGLRTLRLEADGEDPKEIEVRGEVLIRYRIGWTNRRIALISASRGPKNDRTKPITVFVDFFGLPSGERIGSVHKLPFKNSGRLESLCWSADDTHLVIAATDTDRICIVHLPGEKKDEKDANKKHE